MTPDIRTFRKVSPRLRLRWSALSIIGLAVLTIVAGLSSSPFTPFREHFDHPETAELLRVLSQSDQQVREIVRQRAKLLWGTDGESYLQRLGETPYTGYYTSDTTFIQRRTLWRSSLFARDLDFIEVSLHTSDTRFSLRETYAINRQSGAWAVIDSAGFPLFERTLQVTSDSINGEDGMQRFLLTLLSYAGYGSYQVVGSADTIYHGIEVSEFFANDFYYFDAVKTGDTTRVKFTTALINGVEISKWSVSIMPDGLLIDESEQVISYLDIPVREPEALESEEPDPLDSLLADVGDDTEDTARSKASGDTLTRAQKMAAAEEAGEGVRPGAGSAGVAGIRLRDLIGKGAVSPPVNGHVSYEIVRFVPMNVADTLLMDHGPTFIDFVRPVYPPLALAEELESVVTIRALVDSTGEVRKAMAFSDAKHEDEFQRSAKEASAESLFRPGSVRGESVSMWLEYRLTFSLSGVIRHEETPAPDSGVGSGVDSTAESTVDSVSDTLSSSTDSILTDSLLSDTSLIDSSLFDSVLTDSLLADSLSDSTLADTVISDTIPPDTTTPDTSSPDTTTSDTIAPDTAIGDTTTSDTTLSDTTLSDTTLSDTTISDTLTADTTVTPDSSSGDSGK